AQRATARRPATRRRPPAGSSSLRWGIISKEPLPRPLPHGERGDSGRDRVLGRSGMPSASVTPLPVGEGPGEGFFAYSFVPTAADLVGGWVADPETVEYGIGVSRSQTVVGR